MSTPKSYGILQRGFSVVTIMVMILSLLSGTIRPVQAAAPVKDNVKTEAVKNITPVDIVQNSTTSSKSNPVQDVKTDSESTRVELSAKSAQAPHKTSPLQAPQGNSDWNPNPIIALSGGKDHIDGIRTDGSLFTWSQGVTSAPATGTFKQVGAGDIHDCAVHTDGTLECWGYSGNGRTTPPEGTFLSVASYEDSCAIRTDNALICWGPDFTGFARLNTLGEDGANTYTQVGVGENFVCAIRSDSYVDCWGDNSYGQVSPPHETFTQISAGFLTTCGIRTDGTVACWGYRMDTWLPPEGTFTEIVLDKIEGFYDVCGIQTDSNLICWGASESSGGYIPPSGIFAAVASGTEMCGIKADGTGLCWNGHTSGSYPFAPVDLTVTGHSPTELQLTWTNLSSEKATFHIERSPDGVNDWTTVQWRLDTGTNTYIDQGLTTGARYYYRVQACFDPDESCSVFSESAHGTPIGSIAASQDGHWVHARDWPNGTSLTLTVDDPSNGVGIDSTSEATARPASWDASQIVADFNLGDFQLTPGMQLVVTDGTNNRSLTLTSLHITNVDLANDVVSGTAVPGAQVRVCVNMPGTCITRWVTADENGDWSANYHDPGGSDDDPQTVELQIGSNGWAAQNDDDGDQTWEDFNVPNPRIEADVADNWIKGRDWPVGSVLTLTIAGTELSPTATVEHNPNNPGDPNDIRAEFDLGDFHLQPGMQVTLTDGTTSKTVTVSSLAITNFDVDNDTISGTTDSNARVRVCIFMPDKCITRWATPDGEGHWTVNFHTAGGPDDTPETVDIQAGSNGVVDQYDSASNSTHIDWNISNPYVEAGASGNWVHGRGWASGTAVTLTIDDPTTSDTVDFTAHATMKQASWNPGDPNDLAAEFDLQDFQLNPGMLLTITDGVTARTLTLSSMHITAIDQDADIISGVTSPNLRVQVCLNVPNNCLSRWTTADQDGNWSVNYHEPGGQDDSPDTYDIQPGTNGWVVDYDSAGNQSHVDWTVLNPFVEASALSNWVHGRGWPEGTLLNLIVNDPSNGSEVLFTTSARMAPPSWDPQNTNPSDLVAEFDLGNFRLGVGQVLTITDGTTEKSLTLTSLAVTNINPADDTVSGTATPGATVNVCVYTPNSCINRRVIAGSNGAWTTNYAIPGGSGDDPDIVNIDFGTNGWAAEYDNASNRTMVDWQLQNPYVEVNAGSHWAHARGWLPGTPLTLTIHDPDNASAEDYHASATMGQAPWNPGDPNDIVADFDLGNFQLRAGMVMTVTDGITSRNLTLSELHITNIDVEADTISGTTSPNRQVQVCLNMPNNCISRWTTSNDSGNFTVNYHGLGTNQNDSPETHDILPGDNGWAADYDPAGNVTQLDWKVLNPYIEADVANHWLHGREWPTGAELTLTIDDPLTPEPVDFTQVATMVQAPWNLGDPNDIVADFDLKDFQLRPGMLVNVTDGTTARSMTIADMHITQFDVENDLIYGTADAGASVQVCANISNGCITRWVTAAPDGTWMADFHTPGGQGEDQATVDLQPGSSGWAAQKNGLGYQTWLDWIVPNPRLEAWVEEGSVAGIEWPLNAAMTLTIHHPGTPASDDYIDHGVTDSGSQYGNYSMIRFQVGTNLRVGDVVTLTDGQTSHSYTATNLHIDFIDRLHNTVSGFGPANSLVTVFIHGGNCQHSSTSDNFGNWAVDFQDTSNGQTACEIAHDEEVKAFQPDPGHDATVVRMNAPNTHIDVWFAEDKVYANDFPADTLLTLNVQDDQGYPVYSTSGTTDTQAANPHLGGVTFMLNGAFDIVAGQTVTVSGGGYTRSTVVKNLAITHINLETDQITGTADVGSNLWGCAGMNNCNFRDATPDSQGNWLFDYSIPGNRGNSPALDLAPGMSGMVNIMDSEFNNTSLAWNIPADTLHVNFAGNEAHGHDWPIGDSVTLTVDDDHNPANGILYTRTQTVVNDTNTCGMPCFDMNGTGITLQTGQVVTMTDGTVTKTVTISTLHITSVDFAHDVVSGVADPGSSVMVNIGSQGGIARQVTADTSGNWTADFSTTGDQDFEQTTADIVFGDNGRAIQLLGDGTDDGTLEYWSVPYPPAAFTKSGPTNAAINQPLNLTLTWASSSNAASYQYCYSTTNGSCSSWTSTTSTSASLSGLTRNTVYYWQVQALNGSGTITASGDWWSFTTIPNAPAAFGKSAPTNAAVNVSLSPSLSWAASSGAANYQYCYDTSIAGACTGVWSTPAPGTSASLSGLVYATTYRWQVRAVNPGGTTDADGGAMWSFTTLPQAPASFTKTSPNDQATGLDLTPTLSWAATARADSYQYCVSLINGSCNSWISTPDTSVTLSTALVPGIRYYWQVQALNAGGTTLADGGAWHYFTTQSVPGSFDKLSPADGSTNQPLSLSLTWETSPSATSYQYCYSTTNGTCTTWRSAASTTAAVTGLARNTIYYWQVRAVNSSGNTTANGGTWRSFTTIPNAPAAFNKSAPANLVTNQGLTPTLTWVASSGAASYQYCYDTTSSATCDSSWQDVGTALSVVLPALTYSTTYYWQVRATNPGGTTDANAATWWSFTTLPQAPADFGKTSPTEKAAEVLTKPTLSWAPSLRAASYQYCYDTSDDDTCNGAWTTTSATSVTLTNALTAGATYYWQVRAVNPNSTTDADNGAWWSFTTRGQPGAFGKATPATGSVDQALSLNLSWDASSGSDSYEYCYSTTNGTCTTWTSTSGTIVALSGLARNTTYYWEVRAVNPNGKTNADGGAYWSFTTIPSAPAAFAKSAPSNAAASQSISLALSWAGSSGADSYEYCLDTSNNNACDKSWVNTGTDRSINPPGLAYSTTYYWQVRAINPGGTTNANTGSWWSFTTQVDPLSQFTKTFPDDGGTGVVLNPTLRWNPSSGATSYTYCYDTTNDNHCDGMPKSVTGTSATISGLAPGTTYYWQVSAANSSATVEADSGNWFSFTTSPLPGAFAKVAPLSGATNQPVVNLVVDWEGSSNATYYEYCYDTTNDNACSTWISTSATTASLSGLAPNTTYYWQVRGANNSGKTISNDNAWWSFKTQPPAPTAFSKSIPANNASGVALTTSLSWASAGVVENYSYCLDTNPGATCDGPWVDAGTARTVTPAGLNYATTYYWQVRAENFTDQIDANTGTWWSFTTLMPPSPPAPVLVSPANAVTLTDYTTTLDWNDVVSPVFDHYDLQISTTSTFNADTLLYDEHLADSTFTVPDGLAPGKTYYWRVSSVNYLDGHSGWVSRNFKTGWLPPVLGDPVDPTIPDSNRPDFTWQAVDQATGYNLQVQKVKNSSTTVLSVSVTGTTYTPTADLPANTTLFWRMRTTGANGPSAWSDYNQFSTPNPPGIPSLSGPSNGGLALTNTPTLVWGVVNVPAGTEFKGYQVQVATNAQFNANPPIDVTTANNPLAANLPITDALADNTTYYWRVRSINTTGQHSSWSSVWSFRTPMLPPVMDLLIDGDHALTVRPQFVWEAVNTATGYTIQVSKVPNFSTTVLNASITGTTYIPTSDLPRYAAGVTLLYWRVRANGTNTSAWADYFQFTPANPPAVPSLSGPGNGATVTGLRPPFTWGSVSGANRYEIQIATSNVFDDASLIDLPDLGVTFTTSYTPGVDLPDNVTLYWRVRSLNTANEYSFWAGSRSFKTTLPAPALISPLHEALNVPVLPEFTWEDVTDATNYTIQLSTDPSFRSTLVNKTVPTATYKATTALLHKQKIYWRVRANGTNPSPWVSDYFTTIP